VTARIPRSRYIALTLAAGVLAAVGAIGLIGAPPLPALLGIAIAVAWSIYRAPSD